MEEENVDQVDDEQNLIEASNREVIGYGAEEESNSDQQFKIR